MKVSLKYYQGEISLRFGWYYNGRTALTLLDPQGQPIATATTNLPEEPLAPNEVFIKSWSENQGMCEALEALGIIGPTVDHVRTGFVQATKHRLLISPKPSAELLGFLRDWLAWTTSGAPRDRPYRRWTGLCFNAQTYESFHRIKRFSLSDELLAIFEPSAYPFGAEDYEARSHDHNHHLCPKRLAWVQLQLALAP